MSKFDNWTGSGTTAVGVAAMANALSQQMRQDNDPADRAIQAGIDAAMRGVVKDTFNRAPSPILPKVTVSGAAPVKEGIPLARGTGWAKEVPLVSPMPKGSFVEGVIGGMIDNALGPAVPRKAEESGG